jgi:hypothetical protein
MTALLCFILKNKTAKQRKDEEKIKKRCDKTKAINARKQHPKNM